MCCALWIDWRWNLLDLICRRICFTSRAFCFCSTPLSIHSGRGPNPWQYSSREVHVEHAGRFSSHFFFRNRQVQQPCRLRLPFTSVWGVIGLVVCVLWR